MADGNPVARMRPPHHRALVRPNTVLHRAHRNALTLVPLRLKRDRGRGGAAEALEVPEVAER
jgi:hypothetical protein